MRLGCLHSRRIPIYQRGWSNPRPSPDTKLVSKRIGWAAWSGGFHLTHQTTTLILHKHHGSMRWSGSNSTGRPKYPHFQYEKKDFDLISLIKHNWKSSAITPSTKHVKGHQDTTSATLTPMEHLNCVMDRNAKQIARKAINEQLQSPPSLPTSLGFGTITCNSTSITSNLQSSLYEQITTMRLLNRLASIDDEGSDLNVIPLHLQSYATARKEVSLSMKIFITKWISGDTATGKVMKRRKKRLISNCPSCDAPDEDLRHILTCPSNISSSYRNKLLANLIDWLKKSHTHPKIVNFINIGLSNCFFTNKTIDWPPESDIFIDCPIINNALASQLRIG